MPTLEAASRYDNIEKSVNAFIDTNVATGLSLTVHYAGQTALDTIPSQWAEVSYIYGIPVDDVRRSDSGGLSHWVEDIININVFEKMDSGTGRVNLYSMTTLLDNIREIFDVGAAIPVYDYNTGGNPQAGALMVWQKPGVQMLPNGLRNDIGIKQANITVYVRHYAVTN